MLETILMCANLKPEDSEITIIFSEKHRVGVERYLKSITINPYTVLIGETPNYNKLKSIYTPTTGKVNIEYK